MPSDIISHCTSAFGVLRLQVDQCGFSTSMSVFSARMASRPCKWILAVRPSIQLLWSFAFADSIRFHTQTRTTFNSPCSGGRVLGRNYSNRLKSTTNTSPLSTSSVASSAARNRRLSAVENQQFHNILHPQPPAPPPPPTSVGASATSNMTPFNECALSARSSASTPVMMMPLVNPSSTNSISVATATNNMRASPQTVMCEEEVDVENHSWVV